MCLVALPLLTATAGSATAGVAGAAAALGSAAAAGAGGLAAAGSAALASSSLPMLLTIGSTAAGLFGQYQQAEAQADYQVAQAESQNEMIRLNDKMAKANYQNQILAAGLREREAQDADSVAIQQNSIKAAEARATARVAAGTTSGLSLTELTEDFTRQELSFSQITRLNASNRRRAGDVSLETARLEAEGRSKSQRPFIASPIEQPNYIGAAINLGSKGLNIYNQQQEDKRIS